MSGDSKNNQSEFDLLGYHLGLIDEKECREIEAAAPDRSSLDCRCESVEAWLAPLACDEFEVPRDLTARIEARIRAKSRPFADNEAIADGATAARSPFLSGRDLLALAATITLFVGVFLPGFRQVRNQSYQTACANNLRMIGAGLGIYGGSNEGRLPYVASVNPGSVWVPGDPNTSAPSSRGWFKLVEGGLSPRVFVDPASVSDFPMYYSASKSINDFPDPRNTSYNFLRQLSHRPWTRYEFSPRMPIVADMTPLVDNDRRLRRNGPISTNSHAHGGRGQNVLHMDYSARFFTTPMAGPNAWDDLYRLQGYNDSDYTGHEGPQGTTDAFLTP